MGKMGIILQPTGLHVKTMIGDLVRTDDGDAMKSHKVQQRRWVCNRAQNVTPHLYGRGEQGGGEEESFLFQKEMIKKWKTKDRKQGSHTLEPKGVAEDPPA